MRRNNKFRSGVLVSVAGLFLCNFAIAQPVTKETLFVCSHEFALMDTLESVLTTLASSNECVSQKIEGGDANSPSFMLIARNHPEIVHGEISFTGKRLTLVSKNWDVDVHNDIDYGRVLVGLLHKFEEEGHTDCKVRPTTGTLLN